MLRWIAPLFLAAALLAGCQEPKTVGGEINKKPVRSAVSLSPSTTEILGMSASNIMLVGRTSACNYPNTVVEVPVVGDTKPDFEAITKIKPDLVVYDATVYNEADIEKLKSLNLQLLEMNVRTVDDHIKFLRRIGALTANETGINDMVEKIYEKQKTNEATAPNPRPKTAVLLGEPGSEYMAAGLGSFQADVVKWSGGEPVGPDSNKFERISIEALMQWNPDIIVTTADAEAIIADPRLASLRAVKEKHVATVLEPDVLLRAGNRVEKILSQLGNIIRAIAKDSVQN